MTAAHFPLDGVKSGAFAGPVKSTLGCGKYNEALLKPAAGKTNAAKAVAAKGDSGAAAKGSAVRAMALANESRGSSPSGSNKGGSYLGALTGTLQPLEVAYSPAGARKTATVMLPMMGMLKGTGKVGVETNFYFLVQIRLIVQRMLGRWLVFMLGAMHKYNISARSTKP
jgi:hypothetical protein